MSTQISVVVTSTPGWTVTVDDGANKTDHTFPGGTAADAAEAAIVAHREQHPVNGAMTIAVTV